MKYEDATREERMSARRARDAAALRYKPGQVKTLLVAQAPPNELDRYFYFEKVAMHDWLFRYIARGLLDVAPTRANKAELLERLKAHGVFLVDLKTEPMDGSPLARHVPELLTRVRDLAPRRVILIAKPVYKESFWALKNAGLPVVDELIPFPSSGQQRKFQEAFARALDRRLA